MRWSQGYLKQVLTRCERGTICKGGHTEKADEAFRSTQEGEGVDACIGDGDVCERLIRRSDSRISTVGRDKTDGNRVEIGCHRQNVWSKSVTAMSGFGLVM
jgi:hypothetical protein